MTGKDEKGNKVWPDTIERLKKAVRAGDRRAEIKQKEKELADLIERIYELNKPVAREFVVKKVR